MKALVTRVKNFVTSEDGPTATEYAVMLALIIVACLTVISTLGDDVKAEFESVSTELQAND